MAPHIAHITQPYTRGAAQRIDPANLTRVDSRAKTEAQRISVRLLHPLGTKKAGEILTRRTHSSGVLAQLVHNGQAELIEGEIPDPSTYERTFFPVDSRAQQHTEPVTPTNVNDQLLVDRAVDKAFSY